VFYLLVDRPWPGLDAAALATVAAGCLGLLVVADLAPVTVLYVVTAATGYDVAAAVAAVDGFWHHAPPGPGSGSGGCGSSAPWSPSP
jgi:hypothetical protein